VWFWIMRISEHKISFIQNHTGDNERDSEDEHEEVPYFYG
jgi:hypothetical protein